MTFPQKDATAASAAPRGNRIGYQADPVSSPLAADNAKSFISLNQETLSRMVRQKVPVGAPKSFPLTRRDERNQLIQTSGVAKRGGGRYKVMPNIPGLSASEWKAMSRALQLQLISLWGNHSKRGFRGDQKQLLMSSFVLSQSEASSDGLMGPSNPHSELQNSKSSELERIEALIGCFRERTQPRTGGGTRGPTLDSVTLNTSMLRSRSQIASDAHSNISSKWIAAGNKWPLPVLYFSAQCIDEFEKRNGVINSIFFYPPDPALQPNFKPEHFVRRPVCIFDPFWKSNVLPKPACPHCKNTLTRAGWSRHGPRRVFGEYGTLFLVGSVYCCRTKTCISKSDKAKNSHFTSYSDELLTQLPTHLQECFPFVLSKKSGVTKRLAESLFWFKANGVGFGGVMSMLRERYARKRDQHKVIFYSKLCNNQTTLDSHVHSSKLRADVRQAESVTKLEHVRREKFPEHDCPIDVPSAGYLSTLFIRLALLRREFHERELTALRGDALCHDETFQEAKRIVVEGSQPYASLYHIMNGHGQVVAYRSIETRGSDAMRSVMGNVAARYPEGQGPAIFTSDVSCSETDLLADTFPSSRVGGPHSDPSKGLLSLHNSRVYYCKDDAGLQVALQFIEVAIANEGLPVGFDLEWTSEQVPCVMQLAFALEQNQLISQGKTKTTILLIHLSELRSTAHSTLRLPSGIADALSRLAKSGALFVGSNVRGDFTRLRNCFGFDGVPIAQQRELKQTWIRAKGGGVDQGSAIRAKALITNYQLSTLCSAVLGKRLPKPSHVRISDWDAPELSSEQKKYAALDSLASLLIWKNLRNIIVPVNRLVRRRKGNCGSHDESTPVKGQTSCLNGIGISSTDDPVAALKVANDLNGVPEGACYESKHLAVTELKGDIWHFGDRLSRQLSDISDPVCQIFSTRAHEAMLVPYAEDLEAVRAHLVENRGLSAGDAKKVPYKYHKRFVRVRTREPKEMKDMLEQLYSIFSGAKTTTGKPVFKEGMRKEVDALKGHIDDGCLLDKEGFPYYYVVGKTSKGMVKYGCKRGSSALEGFHEAVDNSYSGFWCSPLLYDLTSLLFITRWNRRAAVRNLHEPDYGHFDMFLVEKVISTASKAGFGEYEYYKALPPHNGEKFGCGMPLTLDDSQKEELEEISENLSPPESSPFYCLMRDAGTIESEGSGQLLRADVDAITETEKMEKVSLKLDSCKSLPFTTYKGSQRNGKSITDLNSRICRTIRSGEYLAYLAQLPAPVLPFSSLVETELLLSLLPAFFKKRRRKPVILYTKLAQAYNTCVLKRLEDRRFSFKNTNYVKECTENAMRVSLIQQATERGTFILTNKEQGELRQKFREPCAAPIEADPPPSKKTQEQTIPQELLTSAPPSHFAPRGLPVNYGFVRHAFITPPRTELLHVSCRGLGPVPTSSNVAVRGKRQGPDKCNLCCRERFPATTSNGHRKDGYCPFKKTFTRRSSVGSAILKLQRAKKRSSTHNYVTEGCLVTQFEELRNKFPPSNRPTTVEDLLDNYVPE